MRPRLSPRLTISDILAHIAVDNPAAAAAVGAAIKAALAQIRSFPRNGTETDAPGIFLEVVHHTAISFSTGSTWMRS